MGAARFLPLSLLPHSLRMRHDTGSAEMPPPPQLQTLYRTVFDAPLAHLLWAPRGAALAVGTTAGTVASLNTRLGHVTASYSLPNLRSLDWHPELPAIATGTHDGQVQIWASDRVAPARQIPSAHAHPIDLLQWSRDRPANNAQLAVAAGPQLRLRNIGYGIEHDWELPDSPVRDLQWHPIFRMLCILAPDGVDLWMPEHPEGTRQIPVPGAGNCLRWAPNGAALAITHARDGVILVQTMTAQCHNLARANQAIAHLTWHGQSRLLAGAGENSLLLWNLETTNATPDVPKILTSAHSATIRALAFEPAGPLLASGGDDAQLLLWAPEHNDTPILSMPMSAPITQLVWSACGRQLAVGLRDGAVELLEVRPAATAEAASSRRFY